MKKDIRFTVKEVRREAADYFTFASSEPIEIKGKRIENPILSIQISEALVNRRFQVIKPGDIITLTELDEDVVEILGINNDVISIKSRGFYDKITISSDSKTDKVLSWINNPEGFSLSAAFDTNFILQFINPEVYEETVYEHEVNINVILNELEKYIRNHRQEFQLYRWKHLNKVEKMGQTWGYPWWTYDREIKHLSGNTIHPAVFESEERYQRIYDLLVNNLSVEEYVKIDDNDEDKDYENGAPAYLRRQKWTGHKRTPQKNSQEWEKGTLQETNDKDIIWVINPQSVARHNQNIVEPYNKVNGSEIRRINKLFFDYWNRINNRQESLSASERKLLARIESQSQKKLGEDEEITVFTELQELILLDANDAVEKIVQQANQNFKQIELNQMLYGKKWQLIWWIAQLLDEEKPAVLEKQSIADEKRLSPPNLEDELEFDVDEEEDKSNKIYPSLPNSTIEAITKENLENPAEESEAKKFLSTNKKIACQKIEKLLKKHSLETKDLPAEYQNWAEQIQNLESDQGIAQLVQQIEKLFITKKNQMLSYQTNNTLSSSRNNNRQFFWLGLGMISLSLGGLIILLVSPLNQKNNSKN